MKQTFLLALIALLFLGVQGCEKKTTETVYVEILTPPLGLRSITGDRKIKLLWNTSNYESDFKDYKIYILEGEYPDAEAPREIPSGFEEGPSHPASSPCNTLQSATLENLNNGTTYSFLVVATNNKNEMSRPSNIINDTPRPETFEFDYDTMHAYPHYACGYELSYIPSDSSVTDLSDVDSAYNTDDGVGDFILEIHEFPGKPQDSLLWLAGTNGGGVMDLGFMSDWNDADLAPDTGYASTGYPVVAIQGHVYAIKTGDDYYGKIQIIDVNVYAFWLSLKACYQEQAQNRQYKIRP